MFKEFYTCLLRTTLLLKVCVSSVSSVNTQNTRQKFNTSKEKEEKVVDCWWVLTLTLKG